MFPSLHWMSDPIAFTIIAVLFGLPIGSFLNVVIHRLPKMMERDWRDQCAELAGNVPAETPTYNLAAPASACPKCEHKITPTENIPVLSWLLLGGKCSACKTPISARYPAVELLTGIAFGITAWKFGFGMVAVGSMFLLACLIALTFIDYDTQYLPDSITLPLIWAGLLVNLHGAFVPLGESVIGAVAGYLTLWCVYWGFKLATGKEGMGFGDFKLLSAIGAWLGWKMLPLVILGSSLVGAVVGVSLIVFTKHGKDKPIPFGPYLAAAGVIALFWGARLTDAYLNLVL